MTLKARIASPVPSFFKRARKIGLVLAGIGGAIVAAPVVLPAMIISAGGYLAVAGAVTMALSQAATVNENGEHE